METGCLSRVGAEGQGSIRRSQALVGRLSQVLEAAPSQHTASIFLVDMLPRARERAALQRWLALGCNTAK